MRPIPSTVSNKVIELLNKAQVLEERLDKSQNFQEDTFTAKEASQKKNAETKMGGVGAPAPMQTEQVMRQPNVGGTPSTGALAAGNPPPIQKSGEMGSQPTFNTTFNTNPQNIGFVSESGGQTRNAYYSTNQHLLDSEDVANKGATSSSVSMDKLSGQMNPHDGGRSRQARRKWKN